MAFSRFTSVVPFIFIIVFAFACADDNPRRYMKAEESRDLLVRVSAYTEKKPRHVGYDERFYPENRPYYQRVAKNLNSTIAKLYIDDSLHYFLLTKKEPKSLHGEKRAVGGVFKLDNDSISEMDIRFVTPMMEEKELTKKSSELFYAMAKEKNMEFYFGNPAYMEWPNPDVSYDKRSNRWVISEHSEIAVFKNIMTGRK